MTLATIAQTYEPSILLDVIEELQAHVHALRPRSHVLGIGCAAVTAGDTRQLIVTLWMRSHGGVGVAAVAVMNLTMALVRTKVPESIELLVELLHDEGPR